MHQQIISALLNAAGKTPDRYPKLHNTVNQGSWQNGNSNHFEQALFVDSGVDKNGKVSARVWHATKNDPLYSGSSLIAFDQDNKLLGFGANSNVRDGFLATSINTPTAKKLAANEQLKLLSIKHIINRNGQTQFLASAKTDASVTTTASTTAASATTDIVYEDIPGLTVTLADPVIKKPNHEQIVIALGRKSTHQNNDADYIYTESTNVSSPYLIVPFTGQAELPYEVVGTAGEPLAPPSTSSTSIIFNADDGTTTQISPNPTYTPASRIAAGITKGSTSNMINWSFPADGGQAATTESLVFNQQSLTNGKTSYFQFDFTIAVNGPGGQYSFSVCSEDTPDEPSTNCIIIEQLQFWWHCVAKGSQITLADGQTKSVEELSNKDRVQSNNSGGHLAVEATANGVHQSDNGQTGKLGVYKLTTTCGKALLATGCHPVMTSEELVMISDLKSGDEVQVIDGTSTVVSCEPVTFSGECYNLKLANDEDRQRGHDQTTSAYFANGILVGDHYAMKHQADKRRRDVPYMQARIDADFHTDYANAVADIRY